MGASGLLTLQNVFFNRWAADSKGERQGLIFVNRPRAICGLAVEERTLRLYGPDPRFPNLMEEMVVHGPNGYGHDPEKEMQLN